MNAGELRHRISIDTPVSHRQPNGEATVSWSNALATWAAIRPVSSREVMLLQAVTPQVSHTVTIRRPAGYVPKAGDRVRFKNRSDVTDRIFNIDGVINVDERDVELRLVCHETGGPQ